MSRPTRQSYQPTAEEIERAIREPYEIEMFIDLLPLAFGPGPCGQVSKNAYLEAFLLHARSLMQFFEVEDRKRGYHDVLAKDFGFGVSRVDISADMRTRMDKDLAHWTYQSVMRNRNHKGWKATPFLPLLRRCQGFVRFVLSDCATLLDEEARGRYLGLQQRIDSTLRSLDQQSGG